MISVGDILGVLILTLFCLTISLWERKRTGTTITPFSMTAWPYTFVVILINFGGIHFGFFPVHLKSILFVMGCLIFFLAGGMIIQQLLPTATINTKLIRAENNELDNFFNYYRPLFVVLAIISIGAGFINLYVSIQSVGGWMYIASTEFEDAFGKGILAHIMTINRAAFLFLFADYLHKKRNSTLILLALIFITVLVLQIKNHIITLLLGGLFFAYQFKLIKFNFKKIIGYGILIYVMFNISYIIGFSTIEMSHAYSSKVQLYLLNHFFTYLFGGPIGFSEILKDPVYPLYSYKEIFAIILNIQNTLAGNKNVINVIFYNWIPVSSIYKFFHSSNVFTMFGMLYMYIGLYGTYLYLFLLGIIAYLLRWLSLRNNYDTGWKLIYAFLLSYLTLSFFGLYFNMLMIYEASFFMLMVPLIYRFYKSFKLKLRSLM